MQVSVIGLGNFGTALSQHLANKGYDVIAWTREQEVADGVNTDNRNPVYLSDVPLSERVTAVTEIKDLPTGGVVLLVLPSSALRDVLGQFQFTKDSTLISCVKGMDSESLATPLQLAESMLAPVPNLAVVSGPGFAKDLVLGKPAGLVAASKDKEIATKVAELFMGDTLKIYHSTDPVGVELGGIVKNVIALAAGIGDGLGVGDSARAGVITRGLAEMTRLAVAMGADERTLAGLSGLGDLVLTATCDASRNRTVGLRLGRGESLQEIIESIGSVAEGVRTTPLVVKLGQKHGVELPISEQVEKILSGSSSPQEAIQALLTRPLTEE